MMPDLIRLESVDTPEPDDIAVLGRGLADYNNAFVPPMVRKPFAIFVRDQSDVVVGGIEALHYWRTAYVNRVWVSDRLRGQGVGARMMTMLDADARARGIEMLWLETMDWQAQGFYEKMGYTVFGRLEHPSPGPGDHPRTSIFLQKRLD